MNYKTFYKFLDILKQIFKKLLTNLIYFAKHIKIINEILFKIIEILKKNKYFIKFLNFQKLVENQR